MLKGLMFDSCRKNKKMINRGPCKSARILKFCSKRVWEINCLPSFVSKGMSLSFPVYHDTYKLTKIGENIGNLMV